MSLDVNGPKPTPILCIPKHSGVDIAVGIRASSWSNVENIACPMGLLIVGSGSGASVIGLESRSRLMALSLLSQVASRLQSVLP